jgi:hypothetical protein
MRTENQLNASNEFPTFETVMKVKEVIESTIDNWFAEYGDSY